MNAEIHPISSRDSHDEYLCIFWDSYGPHTIEKIKGIWKKPYPPKITEAEPTEMEVLVRLKSQFSRFRATTIRDRDILGKSNTKGDLCDGVRIMLTKNHTVMGYALKAGTIVTVGSDLNAKSSRSVLLGIGPSDFLEDMDTKPITGLKGRKRSWYGSSLTTILVALQPGTYIKLGKRVLISFERKSYNGMEQSICEGKLTTEEMFGTVL